MVMPKIQNFIFGTQNENLRKLDEQLYSLPKEKKQFTSINFKN